MRRGHVTLDTRQIKYFLTLARYCNFTKAAKYLYLSQSALSRQIIALEAELGVSLFERTSRSVRLTSAGEVFLREGEKLLRIVRNMSDMVRDAERGTSGVLRIGSLGSINHRIAELIGGFHESFEDVYIDIEPRDTTVLTEAVVSGELDLVFTFLFAVEDFEELDRRVLCSEEFYVLISQTSPYAGLKELELDDLRRERIILPHFAHPPFIEDLFIHSKIASLSYADSMEALLLQVESGLGVSLVPGFYIAGRESRHNLLLKKISGYDMIVEVVLAWHKDNANPAVRQFIDLSTDFFPSVK